MTTPALDRIMPLIIVAETDSLRTFYTEQLGFEMVTDKSDEGSDESFVVFAYATCSLGFATQGALPDLPAPTTNAVVILELPEAEPVHRVMQGRAGDVIGPLLEAPWGRYFDIRDPVGTLLRFIEVTAE